MPILYNYLCRLVEEKAKYKDFTCYMKTLTISKESSESRIRISAPAFLLCHWFIFSCVPIPDWTKNLPIYEYHRGRLQEFSGSLASL
jgi:hypothetical protein